MIDASCTRSIVGDQQQIVEHGSDGIGRHAVGDGVGRFGVDDPLLRHDRVIAGAPSGGADHLDPCGKAFTT